jgi:hypothetical protein
MGKQKNIRLRCTVDNIIYYQWKDIDCMRMVPPKVRQTDSTKKEASNFGVAVKYAAAARGMFRKIVEELSPGRSFIQTTDGAFRNWLRSGSLDNNTPIDGIPFFDGLSFNDAIDFRRLMQVPVQINRGTNNSLQLQWPGFNPLASFKAPTGTAEIVVKYLAATLDMRQHGVYHDVKTEFTIPYTDITIPPGNLALVNVTAPGNLALVATAIYYYKSQLKNEPVNFLRWKPSGITASFYN